VQLHTYYSPLNYLATAYAMPAAGAPYVFYPDDVVQFEAKLINKGTVPVSIQMRADPSTQISLSTRTRLGESTPLPRDTWTVASDEIRIQPSDATEVLVAAESSVVLHPGAALTFPLAFAPAATWPSGLVTVAIDFSLECQPVCTVVPFSNLFRFEVRTTLDRVDRMETEYRRALRAFFDRNWDAAERALQALYREGGATPTGLHLNGRIAEARGERTVALRHYRSAEASILAGGAPDVKNRSTSFIDDILHTVRSSIRRLEAVK
jgi:hypothetical protein